MKPWTGKTLGPAFGYRFFIFIIKYLGVRLAYGFNCFVSMYFVFFASKQRTGLLSIYRTGFSQSRLRALFNCVKTFYNFGGSLIDRFAMMTSRRKMYSYEFQNENVLKLLTDNKKGGLLVSAHLGNWEVAGNLLFERISKKINILALDNEVTVIKNLMESSFGKPYYNLIPIKDDFSHLIQLKKSLDSGGMVALHADRLMGNGSSIRLPFMGGEAEFPLGPFQLAAKLKAPISFVCALKKSTFHYSLSATDPITLENAENIAKKYVLWLEMQLKKEPNQWFNFYDYYVN